jgi:hypothetical protein
MRCVKVMQSIVTRAHERLQCGADLIVIRLPIPLKEPVHGYTLGRDAHFDGGTTPSFTCHHTVPVGQCPQQLRRAPRTCQLRRRPCTLSCRVRHVQPRAPRASQSTQLTPRHQRPLEAHLCERAVYRGERVARAAKTKHRTRSGAVSRDVSHSLPDSPPPLADVCAVPTCWTTQPQLPEAVGRWPTAWRAWTECAV